MFHAFEKAYGNIENGDSHRYEKALKEGLCGEPDTGKESSSYNRHYVWTEENYHTADGATTKKLHYAYDVYNRNVSVTGDDFTQKNHYDAEGYRDSITEKDKVTNFVYQGGMLLHELDEDKNPARHYILGNEYISRVDGTSFGYYLNDEQGSVWYLTGSDGSIRNHYRYSAFGETITAEETVPNRLRYNGQMADGLTGLYYLRARYYNASLGRFTQEDVIYNDGLNLYAYCNSNPVMYSDPSGFAKQCDPKVGGEKDSKSGSKTPSEIARSWQGTGKYPGIDDYVDITVEKGTVLYRGEPNGTEYFTTLDAIEQSGRDATKLFEGLQVEKNPIHGYRGEMQGYIFNEDVASAYGITNANPQFGKGGLPQYYVPDVQDLIDKGILTPVDNIKLNK